jgi:hypothetical protein
MYSEALAFGIVDAPSPAGDPELAPKLRDLTISWSRYDYRGRILEAATIEDVLDQAVELGYRWCLVQGTGHIILEGWYADEGRKRLEQCVSDWISERDFLALGAVVGDDGQGYGLDDQCLLVDVRRYRDLGRPAFGARGRGSITGWNLVDTSLRNGLPVHDIGPMLDGRRLSLGRLSPPEGRRLAGYLGNGIRSYADGETWLDPRTGVFLEEVQRQVVNAARGVFLWNLEPYDDVRTPPRGFAPPISTLYSVASGFKPNMILESLGFDAQTRVVFFDYSTKALEVKRVLLEEWDGRDFPAFTRYLFRKLPFHAAYYHLWDGATPETLDPRTAEHAWERELELWGGEEAFEEHWLRYRRLRHEFVRCDVLSSAARLLGRVELEQDAVIWWSNAFFSVWGNWLLDVGERKRLYERWVEALAERNPDLFLYGSDFCNSSVNDVQAADYRILLGDANCDELVPLAANACEIRF